jgi:hypothetical protein
MTDEGVFGKAVDEFYKKLFTMTDSLVAVCNEPSPTLFATAANMMCEGGMTSAVFFLRRAEAEF